jgi:stage II sporulation protein AA (anti-sigma F factor antagonist)
MEERVKNGYTDDTEFEIKGNVLIIYVNGELDHHNAMTIRETADDRVFNNGIKNIIFDFAKTGFMDSSGIGVIMGRYKLVKGIGGKVGVINVKKNIDKILLFSGLNKIIERYENMENAINDMNGGKIYE